MAAFSKTRRRVLGQLLAAAGAAVAMHGSGVIAGPGHALRKPLYGRFEPLLAPDHNGIRLPHGFVSRVVAVADQAPTEGSMPWHRQPDGGAVFPAEDGGWIYVSNCEVNYGLGGASSLRFDTSGQVRDSYEILRGTSRNCAGGTTPWGTWLSCEEVPDGAVWECDPNGENPAEKHDAMGYFNHEAAAVDPESRAVYMTEDRRDGLLYRYLPVDYPDLSDGVLQCAEMTGDNPPVLRWHDVPNPTPAEGQTPTRYQVQQGTAFNRGEGMWLSNGKLVFATTGDNRVWLLHVATGRLELIYDGSGQDNPVLNRPDNVTISNTGSVFAAEDPGGRHSGGLEIVMLGMDNLAMPVIHLTGHEGSEITGPAFDPSGQRLYFSSQRGGPDGSPGQGVTFEISGPFPDLISRTGTEE